MIDQLVRIGLSNTCLALLLAIVAMLTEARTKRPQLVYLLWLLVLAKLITPPILSIPVHLPAPSPESTLLGLSPDAPPFVTTVGQPLLLSFAHDTWNLVGPWLGIAWLLGSGVVLTVSLVRVLKFDRLLQKHIQPAPQDLLATAEDVAKRLKLRSLPEFCFTTANISPLVWWTGGRVRVVIPSALLAQLETYQLRWVVAHELAHVYRRDYLVRWLEWLAGVCFWWNPVVWWARRTLRATEEICCDALVISKLQPEPRIYANSILTAIESLARPILRPPAMASEINSGGFLERRFKMMISNRAVLLKSRWQQAGILLCGMIVLPLGVAYAQDYDALGKRLKAAVEAEEISKEQARTMMGALKHSETASERTKDSRAQNREDELDTVKKKIKAGIERGDVSREEAEAKVRELKKRVKTGENKKSDRSPEDNKDAIKRKLKADLDRGDLSREEAKAKVQELKQRSKVGEIKKSTRPSEDDKDAIKRKVKADLDRGDLSRGEAEAKVRELKLRMKTGENKTIVRPAKVDTDAVKKKLKADFDRRDLSREKVEADVRKLRPRKAAAEDEK